MANTPKPHPPTALVILNENGKKIWNYRQKINPSQQALTKEQHAKLVQNHYQGPNADKVKPVMKLFAGGSATWLLSELDPMTGIAYGLCDLGMGYPEIGYVSLQEMCDLWRKDLRSAIYAVQRDLYWEPSRTLAEYAKDARIHGSIQ
jgi:hypothetical protein